ncbi:50S ribosomal protein L25/general stress protein Ctc [Arthrobacter sp. NPDC090010]|uniref:50S ribosomal protein L25/general stress protein Ctc n=1 Tax=Arthrobacter sp. NPDC090010 TaxID=3363942 RepID=UPI00381865E9
MSETKLETELRTEFGKGYARRARAAGKIPAVVYGHGAEPLHVNLPGRATTLAVRVSNALLNLVIDGEEHLTIVKDIQRDPIKQIIEHIDLLTVKKGEKVAVDVPVHVTGEAVAGVVANQEATTVSLEAEATHVPSAVEFNIDGREAGAHVHASDLVLPKGTALLSDPETLIVNLSEAPAAAAADTEEASEEAAPAAE